MFFLLQESFEKKIIKLLLLTIIGAMSHLNAVDYEGEKTDMVKLPYIACTMSPAPSEAIEAGIIPINTSNAKRLFVEGATFYDARKKSDYNKGHIKEAKVVVFDKSKAKYTAISLPKSLNRSLVFYCYGNDSCANSYEAALAVRKHGYKNVYWYVNGFEDWKKKGYPVDKK